MYAQIAEKEDNVEDPSVAWPEGRKKVLSGVIEITKLSANTPEEDKNLSFIRIIFPQESRLLTRC